LILDGSDPIISDVGGKGSYGRSIIVLALFVGGCRFSIEGEQVAPAETHDMAIAPLVADMAMTPGQVAVDDLAHMVPPTMPPPDLARQPPPPDLMPPNDLMPPCVHVTESFASDPSARWALMGTATYDAANQRLQLTGPVLATAGSAFYAHALYTVAFDARFDFRIFDGDGADGMAFVLAQSGTTAGLTPYGNGSATDGYGLGYYGMAGFAVELDTYQNNFNAGNVVINDPDNNHIAFMRTSDGTHLLVGAPAPNPPLHSAAPRTLHVRFTGTHLLVELDGSAVIDKDVPMSTNFAPGVYFFGFTGASGGASDRHTISNFSLTVGAPDLCF
jgi:hypothetical protein